MWITYICKQRLENQQLDDHTYPLSLYATYYFFL